MPPTRDAPEADGLWSAIQPAAARKLLLAALDSFATHGYIATTTRMIAQRVGMSPAGVYIHYSSKLGARTRTGLIATAIREALVDPDGSGAGRGLVSLDLR